MTANSFKGRGVALTPGVELPGVGPPGVGCQLEDSHVVDIHTVKESVKTNRTARRGAHPSPTSLDNNSKKKETEPKAYVRAVQAGNTRQVPLPLQRCASACAISCTNARWEICATAWIDHVGPAGPGNTCMAGHACNITAVKSRSHWEGLSSLVVDEVEDDLVLRLPSVPRGLILALGSQLLQLFLVIFVTILWESKPCGMSM